jgi:4'-phosphopantetheinyl transferase
MGILVQKEPLKGIMLGIWKIIEDEKDLLKKISLTNQEKNQLSEISSNERRLQWLATRALLTEMLDPEEKISYSEVGKPFLESKQRYISISHTKGYAALILNKNEETGIDIERPSEKISDLAFKFLNEEEQANIDEEYRKEHLTLYWAAKEAMYKYYGSKGLTFSRHLLIDNFGFSKTGLITGRIVKEKYLKKFVLSFDAIEDIYVAFIMKEVDFD